MMAVAVDRPPLPVLAANAKTGMVGVLAIAQGTPHEILVRDARPFYRFATPTGVIDDGSFRGIVYHHTANGLAAKRTARHELNLLIDIARSGDFGLPYNFVVMPAPPFRIWYVNDVDQKWPHTYSYNHWCAIAAYGNYSVDRPDARMVARMTALADALAVMWGRWLPELQHRDVFPTQCPGTHLSPLLPGEGRQRD